MAVVYIDIENSAAQRQGSGPITSAAFWRYTGRMSKAGEFEFEMPATDPKAFAVQKKRVARAYAILNGQRVEVGAGIIDHIEKNPQPDGTAILRVSGNDLVRELTYRSVLNLKLYTGGNPVTHAAAVAAIEAFAPAGWTFTADGSPPHDSIYGYFNGETVLQGAIKVADKSQNHFYKGDGRSLIFASDFTPSGVRAIRATGRLVANTCAITALTQKVDTYDLITRIYPRGSGNAEVQLTLRATSRTAPAGYTLNAAQNYIEHDASVATYGVIERQIDYRDIGPIDNTATDIQSAANALFDAAIETLQRRSTELEQETYALQVEGCSQLLRPMQSIRVAYRDLPALLNINDDLNILESTWQVDSNGVQTTDLVVSNVDQWPKSDVGVIVDGIEQGHVYQALQQLNANSYTMPHLKHIDDTEVATIDLDLGSEVTQVQQILMRFRLKAFESTVRSVGGASSGSGEIPTTGPSTNTSGNPSNNTSGTPSTNTSGSPSTDTSGAATGNTGAASGDTGAATGNTGVPSSNVSDGPNIPDTTGPSTDTTAGPSTSNTSTPSTNTSGMASGSTDTPSTNTSGTPSNNTSGASTGSTATPSTNTSGTPSDNESTGPSSNISDGPNVADTGGSGSQVTDGPQGGDIVSAGQHVHAVPVFDQVGNLGNVTLHDGGGGIYFLANASLTAIIEFGTRQNGNHEHEMGNHTHGLASHTHSMQNHTHGMGFHTHNLNNHTHSLNNHTHGLNSHTHSLNSHTHSLNNHTHGLSNHTHTLSSHTHTLSNHTHLFNHTHTMNGHTHGLGSHTHNLNSHTHSLGSHTHSLASHTHTLNSHTHDLGDHTHNLGNHIHDLSESITAIYGIFREEPANTYGIGDLEYQVNSGGWIDLDTATDLGGGRYELDITSLIVNATTLRQNQELNTIDFRRDPLADADKTVMLDVQVKVRTIIQAIALA